MPVNLLLPQAPDPVEELRAQVYKYRRPQPQDLQQIINEQRRPEPIVDIPELRPEERFESGLENLRTRLRPSESLETYSRQTQSTLQGQRNATSSLVRIMEAQRVEAARIAAERLENARRTSSGQITSVARAPGNVSRNAAMAQAMAAANYGWTGREWDALYKLGMLESGWNNLAQNPNSSAYGIGQFLDATWKTVGAVKTSDPGSQIWAMLRYIKQKYGTPSVALAGYRNRYGPGRSGY